MIKKVVVFCFVFSLLSLTASCTSPKPSTTYKATVYDLINFKNIKTIEIRHSGPEDKKPVINNKDKEELIGYLKELKCKKSTNQEERKGWSFFIDFFYKDGSKDRITFQGSQQILFNSTRYDVNSDIRKKVKEFFDSLT